MVQTGIPRIPGAGALWSALWPAWLGAPGLGLRRIRRIHVTDIQRPDAALNQIRKGQIVTLEIAREAALIRKIPVPLVALRKGKAAALADTELRQTLPLGGKGLVWRMAAALPAGIGAAEVTTYVLKTAQLGALSAAVQSVGGRIAQIRLAGLPQVPAFIDNSTDLNRGTRLWSFLALAVPFAVLAQSALGDWRATEAARAAQVPILAELAALATQAIALREAAQIREMVVAAGAMAGQALGERRRRVWQLAQLSVLVPDDVWLSEMILSGGIIQLSGFARGDVVALVEALQAAPWVRRAQLDGPVQPDSLLGQSRFDITITLAPLDPWP